MLNRVVKSRQDIGKVARAIGRKCLERKNLRLRRNEVHKSSGHRAVAECRIRLTVQNRRSGLIEYGGGRLLHQNGLLILRTGVYRPR